MYIYVHCYINILLIAIKTSNQNTGQKLIAVNEMYMYMLHIIYAQDNIWWDNTIVGYNNYTRTVIRVTTSYMISIGLQLKH